MIDKNWSQSSRRSFSVEDRIMLYVDTRIVHSISRDVAGINSHGNFVALLNFRIEAGDTVLQEHLSTTAQNATYTSNTIQNQIISAS